MLKVEEIEPEKMRCYLNLYTLTKILSVKREALKGGREFSYSEHAVIQYFVVGPVTVEEFRDLYSEGVSWHAS